MAGRRECPPFEVAPFVRRTSAEDLVERKAIRMLAGVVQPQRLRVPAFDQRRFAFRQRDGATVGALDCRVAADMVGVAVRVDDFRQRVVTQPARRTQQRQSQRRVAHVAGVDQYMTIWTPEHDVVRREPVADEDVNLCR